MVDNFGGRNGTPIFGGVYDSAVSHALNDEYRSLIDRSPSTSAQDSQHFSGAGDNPVSGYGAYAETRIVSPRIEAEMETPPPSERLHRSFSTAAFQSAARDLRILLYLNA
jgi:hypothetical protein